MKCPNCDRNIDESFFPSGLAFCPYCGQDLRSGGEERERLVFCPYCGQELFDQNLFCPRCGKKLELTKKGLSRQRVGNILLERAAKPVAKAVRNAFSSERKVRKLFQQWSEYSELPPEEIPSMETLREMPKERRAKHSPRWYLVVGIATLIIAAIIILLVTRS